MKNVTKLQKRIMAFALSFILLAFSVLLNGCTYVETFDAPESTDAEETEPDLLGSETTVETETAETEVPETETVESETAETETAETEVTETAHEHNYLDATCTSPKVCTDCGETYGEALGHDYVDGKCTVCGQSDPDYESEPAEVMVWIPTNGGKKYHSRSNCSNMIDPDYVTLSEAIALGFEACKRCH